MRLATRYRWSIVLERVLKKIRRKLTKAAPRFELGIKDLQSSALPLGHAARHENTYYNSVGISQRPTKILFLSNGHGEDLIALRIIKAIHNIRNDISVEVFPLVGEGKIFDSSISEGWLKKIGPIKSMPSGGFANQSFIGLLSDIYSGLVSLLFRQFFYTRKIASKDEIIIVAVGDFLPLLMAWFSGSKYFFIGTPKSDYTWTSGPVKSLSDNYHRLKGTEWDPWECSLMKALRCQHVFVRDQITARGLRRNGVDVSCLGNPMMDCLSLKNSPDSLRNFRKLILLCGTRMPEALNNFRQLLTSAIEVRTDKTLAVLVPTGSDPSINCLVPILSELGFVRSTDKYEDVDYDFLWIKKNHLVFLGPYKFDSWANWGEIGLANAGTATEQIIGLGIPCASIPGNGPQFTKAFAMKQSRLLGGSVKPARTIYDLTRNLELLLKDEDLRKSIGNIGKKRMGDSGASSLIANVILKLYQNF